MAQITVQIIPNSSRTTIVGMLDGVVKIKIQEPADNFRANQALIIFVSKKLSISKKNISIISGEKSRRKILSIECPFSVDQVLTKLLIENDASI